MAKIAIGLKMDPLDLVSVHGDSVSIPHESNFTHLQFRRFAGCPMCNLHIQEFIRGHQRLLDNRIQEVAVFHSTSQSMIAHHADAPFALIADPEKLLYKKFGVEKSILAVLHPSAWWAGLKGVCKHGAGAPERGESVLGLPADFLIDRTGRVVASKYGTHAYDQWSLEEVIEKVQTI